MDTTKRAAPRATVLVVDDERETADLYTAFLAEEYTVRTAYSGSEALELADETVDVVLLDRKMPGLTGDEVLRTIRERELDCRVVMVTAIDPDEAVLDLSFDDYLVKPVSRDDIEAVVSAMCLRNSCDKMIQDVVALASKMATIESKLSVAELASSERYGAIEAQFNTLRAEVDLGSPTDDLYKEFTVEKVRALFSTQNDSIQP